MASIINVQNEESLKNPYSEKRIESIKNFVQEILFHQNLENWEVNILFSSDEFIRDLNKNYRNIDSPTDVLSFEQGDFYMGEDEKEYFCAGDIVISDETLTFNAEKFNIHKDDELKRLVIHGILHLSGFDHGEYHVDANGNILDGNSTFVVLNDETKTNEEIQMLVLQETIFSKFNDRILEV